MPAPVALTPRFEAFIRELLDSGSYNNGSAVVRDGLRLLERQQQEEAAKLAALRRASRAGLAQIAAGKFAGVPVHDIAGHVAGLAKLPLSRVRKAARR